MCLEIHQETRGFVYRVVLLRWSWEPVALLDLTERSSMAEEEAEDAVPRRAILSPGPS